MPSPRSKRTTAIRACGPRPFSTLTNRRSICVSPEFKLASPASRLQSPEWDRIHQATVGPQRVLTTFELERRVHADIALVALAVVTDLFDDVVHPLLVDAHRLAIARRDAEETLDCRIVALQHLVDVLRRDAHLLRLDHAHQGPFHEVEPLVVTVAHDRAEGLLGDSLR